MYGHRCAHCGWLETNHLYGPDFYNCVKDSKNVVRGYRKSLNQCKEFVYSKRDGAAVAARIRRNDREMRQYPISHSFYVITACGAVDIGG